MTTQPLLSVVIPALNEEATIATVVRTVLAFAGTVFVVDDGSTDGTAQAAKAAGAVVLSRPSPLGYDAAIAWGMNTAFERGAEAVVTCDADGQHRAEDIWRVVQPVLQKQAYFSAGLRDHYNRPIEKICGILSGWLFQTRDPFCGLKCYSAEVFRERGPFPTELNIQTLPLLWVRRQRWPARYLEIQCPARQDQPRFATAWRGNVKLAQAFIKTVRQL